MPVPNYNEALAFYQDMDPFVLEELAGVMKNKSKITGINTPAWFNSYLTRPSAGLVSRQDYTSRVALQNLLDVNQERINKRLAHKNTLLNPEKASGIASAVVGGIGLLGDAINEGRGNFGWDAYGQFNAGQERELSDYNSMLGAANTTNDLLQVNDSAPDFVSNANNIKTKEFGLEGMLKGAGTGAALGTQIMPGIGTAIGAAAGFLVNGIGQGFGVFGDVRRQQQAQRDALAFDMRKSLGLTNAQNRVSTNTYRQGMANFLNNAAMGGPLSTHGSDFSDGLIRIDAGGTHEQNPLGGVPAGVDPNGIPNLVEEGETIWEDYVFSDRLKTPKALVKKYALGGGKKGLTYSEAARKVSEKSGTTLRPNDPISKRTEKAILSELEESQEEKRIAKEQRDAIKAMSEMSPEEFEALFTAQPQPAPMQAQVPPQGVEEEILAEQPLMQEPVGFEPTGLQDFALGGNLFDKGGSKAFAKRARLFRNAINNGTLVYHPDTHTYVGYVPGYGKVNNSESFVKGVINTPQSKKQQAIIEAYNHGALKQNEGGFWSGDTSWGAIAGMSTKDLESYLEHPVTDAQRKVSEDYKGRKAQEREAKRQETRELYQNLNAANTTSQAPQRHEVVGPYQDPLYDSRVEPNLRGLRTLGNRGIVDSENPWYSYLIPTGDNPVEIVNGVGVVSTDQHGPFLPQQRASQRGSGSSSGSRRVSTSPASILSTLNADVAADTDALADAILSSTPTVRDTPINLGNDNFVINRMSTPSRTPEGRTLPTWMRYAPIIGGGLSVLSDVFSRPDYSGYESLLADSRRLSSPVNIPVQTIGNRIRRNPFDERLSVNQANQNLAAGLRSTANNAGGNRAYRQFANNLMAYNNQGQLSDIARNAYLANRQDAFQTAEFNRGTDMYNTSAINQRNLTQAQLNANRQSQGYYARANALNALENARRYDDQLASADLTAFLTSLGNLGRENFDLNRLEALRREGRYNIGYNGRTGDLVFSPTETYTVANGGKIKTKKRRF